MFKKPMFKSKIFELKNYYYEKCRNFNISVLISPLYILIALIFLPFLIIYKKIKDVDIVYVDTSRIGHFVIDSSRYLALSEKLKRNLLIFFQKENCSNIFFYNKIRSINKTTSNFFLCSIFFLITTFNLKINLSKIKNRNKFEDWDIFENLNLIDFNEEEKKIGDDILKKEFGINNKQKFVCLLVRDGKYLNDSLSEYEYRNYDINKFTNACVQLNNLGYKVIRMGNSTEKKINETDKIIDYSHSKVKSDFLDFYILSKCEFAISTTFGLDTIPFIFNKPIGYLSLSLGFIYLGNKNAIYLPTKFKYLDKKTVSLSEMFSTQIAFTNHKSYFNKIGVTPVPISSKDINKFVIECYELFILKKRMNYNTKITKKFWDKFEKNYPDKFYNSLYKKVKFERKCEISFNFIRENENIFF